jgi:hypothetical protein
MRIEDAVKKVGDLTASSSMCESEVLIEKEDFNRLN